MIPIWMSKNSFSGINCRIQGCFAMGFLRQHRRTKTQGRRSCRLRSPRRGKGVSERNFFVRWWQKGKWKNDTSCFRPLLPSLYGTQWKGASLDRLCFTFFVLPSGGFGRSGSFEFPELGFWQGHPEMREWSMVARTAKPLAVQDPTRVSAPLSWIVIPRKWLRTAWFCRKKRSISRSLLCGLMLFVLGLVSLFIGQIAADREWSRIRVRWESTRVWTNEARTVCRQSYFLVYLVLGYVTFHMLLFLYAFGCGTLFCAPVDHAVAPTIWCAYFL